VQWITWTFEHVNSKRDLDMAYLMTVWSPLAFARDAVRLAAGESLTRAKDSSARSIANANPVTTAMQLRAAPLDLYAGPECIQLRPGAACNLAAAPCLRAVSLASSQKLCVGANIREEVEQFRRFSK